MNSGLTVVLQSLDTVLIIIFFTIFIRAVVSWLPLSKENIFIKLLNQITEPILAPIRSLIEKTSFGKNSMIDLSSAIAMLIIMIIRNIIGIF